jgi:hypothetical protein
MAWWAATRSRTRLDGFHVTSRTRSAPLTISGKLLLAVARVSRKDFSKASAFRVRGRKFQGPRGRGQDRGALKPGDLIEKPRAAREHQKPLALHLQQAQGVPPLVLRSTPAAPARQRIPTRRSVDGSTSGRRRRSAPPRGPGNTGRRVFRRPGRCPPRPRSRRCAAGPARPGSSPAWWPNRQPQSDRQRSTPWAQLHDEFSWISTSQCGGAISRNCP